MVAIDFQIIVQQTKRHKGLQIFPLSRFSPAL